MVELIANAVVGRPLLAASCDKRCNGSSWAARQRGWMPVVVAAAALLCSSLRCVALRCVVLRWVALRGLGGVVPSVE